MQRATIILLLVLVASPATAVALGTSCGVSDLDLDCAVAPTGIELLAERLEEFYYVVAASACLAAPGQMVVEWWVELADAPLDSRIVASQPTGDAACPHRASLGALVTFGTFDPPYACGQIGASTAEGAASRVVCEMD